MYLVLKSKHDPFREKSLSSKHTHILDGVFLECLHNQESFSVVITNDNLSKDKTLWSQILPQNFIDFCFTSFWLINITGKSES